MIIECPNCNKKFNVDKKLIPENGRTLKCSSCDHIWHYKIPITDSVDDLEISEAKNSGADVFGSDDLIEKISSGKFNFTKLICTPGMMGKIGKHGKVLGPKGLMPNPKLGTVTNDISKAVNDIKSGLTEIRNDKDGNLASTIGRKTYATEKLEENFRFFIDSIKKEKPDTIKGEFIKNIFITSTMGISYKVGAK